MHNRDETTKPTPDEIAAAVGWAENVEDFAEQFPLETLAAARVLLHLHTENAELRRGLGDLYDAVSNCAWGGPPRKTKPVYAARDKARALLAWVTGEAQPAKCDCRNGWDGARGYPFKCSECHGTGEAQDG